MNPRSKESSLATGEPIRKVTIAIPTHNRADSLRLTVESLFAQQLPANLEAECLVIDNASSDSTPAVVDALARSAPFAVRRIAEPRLGSSFARNRAIDESSGDVILFIDDDAIAEPDWAAQMVAEMARRGLDAACGLVVPRWPGPVPQWLGPRLWVKLAVHDAEAIARRTPQQNESLDNYFSANTGFRRSALARFGKFREDLGVVGGNPLSGEDTELFARIIAMGGAMGFVPSAVVHHMIGRERMTRTYLLKKSFAYGVGSAFAGGRSHNRLDKLAKNLVRMAGAGLGGDAEGVVYHALECTNFLGYWRGRMSRTGRAGAAQSSR